MKTCTKCSATHPLDYYSRDATKPDGRHPHCRDCRNAQSRRYNQNPKRKAYVAAWDAANREHRRTYYTTYRKRHPERVRESRARSYPKFCEYRREYRIRNRQKIRAYHREYERMKRARIRAGLIIPFTQDELVKRLSMYPACWICGIGPFEHVDHVKPLAKGGPHMLANLRPSCRWCNYRKRARWPFHPSDISRPKGVAAHKEVQPSLS